MHCCRSVRGAHCARGRRRRKLRASWRIRRVQSVARRQDTKVGAGREGILPTRRRPERRVRSVIDYRSRVLDVAKAEIGQQHIGHPKVTAYWRSVLPPSWTDQQVLLYSKTKQWCGGFALWCLKQAGLAAGVFWRDGLGFLGPARLHTTTTPSRGDVGYIAAPFQHHLLFDFEHEGKVHSVDGNQPDVREKTRPRAGITFYSIQPLIDAVTLGVDTKPVASRPTVWIGHCDLVSGAELQTLLNAHGEALKVDGHFGKLTDEAVSRFQERRGLTTDGIVGSRTWTALETPE